MKKQTLTAIEIETLALSTSIAPDERRAPVSVNGEDYPSKPETRERAALPGLIESFALAACGMAGVYGAVWLDPPDDAGAADTPPRGGSGDGASRLTLSEEAPNSLATQPVHYG
jgi:hypothetical protein